MIKKDTDNAKMTDYQWIIMVYDNTKVMSIIPINMDDIPEPPYDIAKKEVIKLTEKYKRRFQYFIMSGYSGSFVKNIK